MPRTDRRVLCGRRPMAAAFSLLELIVAMSVLVGAHPMALYCAALVNALRPKTKHLGIIGSFGWGSKMIDQLTGMLGNVKAEILEPVLAKGIANEKVYTELDDLADKIVTKHKALGLM